MNSNEAQTCGLPATTFLPRVFTSHFCHSFVLHSSMRNTRIKSAVSPSPFVLTKELPLGMSHFLAPREHELLRMTITVLPPQISGIITPTICSGNQKAPWVTSKVSGWGIDVICKSNRICNRQVAVPAI